MSARQTVISLIKGNPQGLSFSELALLVSVSDLQLEVLLRNLKANGDIILLGGAYYHKDYRKALDKMLAGEQVAKSQKKTMIDELAEKVAAVNRLTRSINEDFKKLRVRL